MEQSLTLLYTGQISGDLALLPRLYTFLKMLRAEFSGGAAGDPAGRPYKDVLLCDLGATCDPAVWHCAATEGRSALIVLDAMGYAAANVARTLTDTQREKLAEQVNLRLVDGDHPHAVEGVVFFVGTAVDDHTARLAVDLSPANTVRIQDAVLHLAAVEQGQCGVVRLQWTPDVGWSIAYTGIHELPPGTAQDPTIAGTVEFVEDEARYLLKRKGG